MNSSFFGREQKYPYASGVACERVSGCDKTERKYIEKWSVPTRVWQKGGKGAISDGQDALANTDSGCDDDGHGSLREFRRAIPNRQK
jgi:hypothetical protein